MGVVRMGSLAHTAIFVVFRRTDGGTSRALLMLSRALPLTLRQKVLSFAGLPWVPRVIPRPVGHLASTIIRARVARMAIFAGGKIRERQQSECCPNSWPKVPWKRNEMHS